MKSPKLTNQPVIVDCNFDHQWYISNDVTHPNIPRNRTGVVAEILCVAGSMCGEWKIRFFLFSFPNRR